MLIHTLHTSLPPPPPSDDPEAIARRDRDAIAQVASLLPVTAAEGRLAARFVAADAQAHECLRLARLHPTDVMQALKCNAQASSMWRQSESALRALQRMQAARCKRDRSRRGWAGRLDRALRAGLHGRCAAWRPGGVQARSAASARAGAGGRRWGAGAGSDQARPSSTPRSIAIARWRSADTAACRPTRTSRRRRTTSLTPWSLAERPRCWRWIGRRRNRRRRCGPIGADRGSAPTGSRGSGLTKGRISKRRYWQMHADARR